MKVPTCAARTGRHARESADSRRMRCTTWNIAREHRPPRNALIVARQARARSRCGYAARRGTLLTSTFREACHASKAACMRSHTSGPSPKAAPRRTTTSAETGLRSRGMCSRSSAPGWVGPRFGFRFAMFSPIAVLQLMVLLQVRTQRVPVFKLERQAPRSIDVHGVTPGLATKGPEVKAWHIHLLHRCGGIQSVQPAQDALAQPAVDFPA